MAKPDADKVGTKRKKNGEPVVQFTTLKSKNKFSYLKKAYRP